MKGKRKLRTGLKRTAVLMAALLCVLTVAAWAQTETSTVQERSYAYSAEKVRTTLEQLGAYTTGKLPMVDGFVAATVPPMERYERPYYQYRLQLVPGADGVSTVVRVEARISAWYAAENGAPSEYRALGSNGRLEADLLDRLQAALGGGISANPNARARDLAAAGSVPARDASAHVAVTASVAAPNNNAGALTRQEQLDAILAQRQAVRERTSALTAQIAELKTATRKPANAARVAWVKRSGVGVMSRKNFGGPVLFRAQAEDEFEVLTLEAGWAVVRLTPETTGFVQADELQLPEGMTPKPANAVASASASTSATTASTTPSGASAAPDVTPNGTTGDVVAQTAAAASGTTATRDLGFWVSREDVKTFSGDWVRLKGKKVLFVYAQPRGLLSDLSGDDAKLVYAKRVFQSRYKTAGESTPDLAGVVVVFLGSKGGVAAATLADIRQWVEGALPEAAFVNRCSLDPPAEFHGLRAN